MSQIAILGAGPAGLAAAQRLTALRPDLKLTIFEKSRGLAGRAATRRNGPFTYDHGAQYLKAPAPAFAQAYQAPGLASILLPVDTLSATGALAPGDPEANARPKLTYERGIAHLGRVLLPAAATLLLKTQVSALEQTPAGWVVLTADDARHGPFAAVLCTLPAPQASALIAASALERARQDQLVAALDCAAYRPCLTLVIAFDRPLPRPWYALVNPDRAHPISWLAREDVKPGRTPADTALLIAQMAPAWSQAHWDLSAADAYAALQPTLAAILEATLPEPILLDRQGWRYALPDTSADLAALYATPDGLFWAGDGCVGKGHVHSAIASGWEAAERIAVTPALLAG